MSAMISMSLMSIAITNVRFNKSGEINYRNCNTDFEQRFVLLSLPLFLSFTCSLTCLASGSGQAGVPTVLQSGLETAADDSKLGSAAEWQGPATFLTLR